LKLLATALARSLSWGGLGWSPLEAAAPSTARPAKPSASPAEFQRGIACSKQRQWSSLKAAAALTGVAQHIAYKTVFSDKRKDSSNKK